MSLLDVKAIRKDFPILSRKVHGQELVYLDNAATSQTPQAVIDSIVHYYSHYNANIHRGVHSLSQEATDAYEQARIKIQKHFNAAHAHEIILTAGTTHAIKRAVVDGEPLISRVTTMTGEACEINRNYDVLIGTPVAHMLEHNNFDTQRCSRVIMGGPMMGFSLTSQQIPIVKTTNCILAPSVEEIPLNEPAQPCIRCGMCAEACPASLLPQQLLWYSQAKDHDRLQSHNLFDCIECGACSYVCPSNIPLVQHYRSSKSDIKKAQEEKIKSDQARERFEFRQQRIELAEKEREAKRAARREAAKQAKASTGTDSMADIVAAAQARTAAKKTSPEQELAKLERAVSSAEMRVQKAQDKLDAATAGSETDEKINILSAALSGAQQKLEKAKNRLAEHSK